MKSYSLALFLLAALCLTCNTTSEDDTDVNTCDMGCNKACLSTGIMEGIYTGTATLRHVEKRNFEIYSDTSFTQEETFEVIHVDSAIYQIKWATFCPFFSVHNHCDANYSWHDDCFTGFNWKYDVEEIYLMEYDMDAQTINIAASHRQIFEDEIYDTQVDTLLYYKSRDRYIELVAIKQ